MPKISLLVVINGPVAIAGSIPLFSKIIGIEVPINAATTITHSIDKEIVILNSIGKFVANPKTIVSNERISPLIKLNPNSFKSRLIKLPFTTLLASPCTIIAEDCTPTFPAIAAISGVKKNNAL